MKNIYKIKLFLITLFVFSSCAIDNDDPVRNIEANIEASFASNEYSIDAAATSYDLTVELSTILPKSAQVDYTFEDGTTAVARGEQGANTITISVDMSNHIFRVITLTDIILFYASAQNTTITVSDTNNIATILKGGTIAPTIVTTVGDLTFNFTWAGAGNDLDCRILDYPATTIFDTGYSTTPGESVTLLEGVSDGFYTLTVRPWTVVSSSIDYNIDIVVPTETSSYTGNFMNLTGGWSMEFIVILIEKITDGTTVTYNVYQF